MTSVFEISKKIALEKFDEVKSVSDFVSYSSKTNPTITKILEKNRNCFFSIHSLFELENVEDKNKVIFLAQGWDEEEIKKLLGLGIKYFVVDNSSDLEILKKFMKTSNEKINLFLRLKLRENTIKTEKYFVFGFSSDFINEEIPKLKKENFIESLGIHFHRKTQNISEWEIQREIENSIKKETLETLNYIVIGGGLPSVYANTNICVFDGIFKKISETKKWMNSLGIKMIIEPGRFIAAPAGKLITTVKSVYENNIVVDSSVYNSDLDALIVPVKLLIEGEVQKEEGSPYVIKGITPCSMDLFRYRVYLKETPKIRDKITFLNAGAYNFTTNFCNLPEIETVIIN